MRERVCPRVYIQDARDKINKYGKRVAREKERTRKRKVVAGVVVGEGYIREII